MSDPVRSVLIVGEGVAAWFAALVLKKTGMGMLDIRVMPGRGTAQAAEDELLGSTLPQLGPVHAGLGIDEAGLLRATRGTYKLGTEYLDWGAPGERYVQAFGDLGARLDSIRFHQLLARLHAAGERVDINEYSVAAQAARLNHFAHPAQDPRSPASTYSYAVHFDSRAYADQLRALAERLGVVALGGRLAGVQRRADGFIESVSPEGGEPVRAELFIDATGHAGELIGALGVGFESWAQWLPVDRAIVGAIPRELSAPVVTRVSAHAAGCHVSIPLQDGNLTGFIHRGGELSTEQALLAWQEQAGTRDVAARVVDLAQGRRERCWSHNCIAIGASATVLEPQACAGVQLIHSGLMRLLSLFPDRHCDRVLADEYNRVMAEEQECIRDLVILHYHATRRDDSDFWRECRSMSLPGTLAHKIGLFRHRGVVRQRDEETFGESDWTQVFLGQGIWPERIDPLAAALDLAQLRQQVERMRQIVRRTADALPPHETYLGKSGILAVRR